MKALSTFVVQRQRCASAAKHSRGSGGLGPPAERAKLATTSASEAKHEGESYGGAVYGGSDSTHFS